MYQPLQNETIDLRPENEMVGRPSENETTGPPIAIPDKPDDRRDNQLKPDDGSSASSITATAAPDKTRAKLAHLGAAINLRAVLSIASLVSLALAFAFVSWLWWTPHDDPDDHWRRLILVPNRLQLSINIASLVIRTAIGILAASAATMVASVAVERYGVRLHAVAPVSIARFASNGSLALAGLALQDSISSFFLRVTLLCLALTTIASQFTSTLLVADLERSHIISFPRPASGAYCPTSNGELPLFLFMNNSPKDYWMEKPQLSETYAEYTETGLTADGVDDTGVAIRAFLPFRLPEIREMLQAFEGKAAVLNSRITCVRPKVSDLRLLYNATLGYLPILKIFGTAQIDDLAIKATLGVDPETQGVLRFECSLGNLQSPRYCWQICGFRGGSWANFQDPLGNNYSQPANIFSEACDLVPLILRLSSRYFQNYEFITKDSKPAFFDSFKLDINNSTKSGPWTQLVVDTNGVLNGAKQIEKDKFIWKLGKDLEMKGLELSEIQEIQTEFRMERFHDAERLMRQRISDEDVIMGAGEDLRRVDSRFDRIKSEEGGVRDLRMTVCTEFDFDTVGDSTALNHVEIFASSAKPRTEPTYGLGTDWVVYDTSVVRSQLGAIPSPTTPEDRQIMSIRPDILRSSLEELYEIRRNGKVHTDHYESDRLLKYWFTIANLDWSKIRNKKEMVFSPRVINQVYLDLMGAIINETNSPARALQAVYFSRFRKVYNELINLIPPRDDCNITVTTFELATVPRRQRGYWAVVGISGTFLICFVVIYVLFDSTRCSLPDNAWHTIAQVSESAEISAILSRSKTKTDKEVVEISKYLRDDDEEDRFIVRGGVFARASMWSTAAKDDSEGEVGKTRTDGMRRRLMARLRAPRDGTIEREP